MPKEEARLPPMLGAEGAGLLPPESVSFRRFFPFFLCKAKALQHQKEQKSLALGCLAVFTEPIGAETRRSPQGILPYFQGLQRSIGSNQPVKTDRGSASSAPDPTRRSCRSPPPRRCRSGWPLCRPGDCASRGEWGLTHGTGLCAL